MTGPFLRVRKIPFRVFANADVVFIGDSRVAWGISQPVLSGATRTHGIRFFNLSFPHGDGMALPLKIFQKYRIGGKIVVVNLDNAFLSESLSHPAQEALATTRLSSFLNIIGDNARYTLSRLLAYFHAPAYCYSYFKIKKTHATYRPARTGALYSDYVFTKEYDIRKPIAEDASGDDASKPSQKSMQLCEKFIKEMHALGNQVLFILIPYNGMAYERTEALASMFHVPFVKIGSRDLFTYDGSHLGEDSARLYTSAMLAKMFAASLLP